MKTRLFAVIIAMLPLGSALAEDSSARLTPPKGRPMKVAVVLSEYASMVDFAGPWEVFQDAAVDGRPAFELYTVAPSKEPLHTTGANRPGMTVSPDYSFDDAPVPDLIVIGAQRGGPGLSEWLQKMHAHDVVILSVCTGAFKVAKAGLFDGKEATTHHDFFDDFARQFPNVKLVRTERYLQSSPTIYSAGGITSGIDLALHVVAVYFGNSVAQQTADYMEYQSKAWVTGEKTQAP